jgi:hypothetical protein
MRGKKIECARGSIEIVAGTSICIACEVVALGGGGGDADAVAESDARTIGALEAGALLCVGDGVGSGVADAVGELVAVGSGVGVALGCDELPSTVPMIGLSKSSASERGATKTRAIKERPNIALIARALGAARMLERVIKIRLIDFFHRVIPEGIRRY